MRYNKQLTVKILWENYRMEFHLNFIGKPCFKYSFKKTILKIILNIILKRIFIFLFSDYSATISVRSKHTGTKQNFLLKNVRKGSLQQTMLKNHYVHCSILVIWKTDSNKLQWWIIKSVKCTYTCIYTIDTRNLTVQH